MSSSLNTGILSLMSFCQKSDYIDLTSSNDFNLTIKLLTLFGALDLFSQIIDLLLTSGEPNRCPKRVHSSGLHGFPAVSWLMP